MAKNILCKKVIITSSVKSVILQKFENISDLKYNENRQNIQISANGKNILQKGNHWISKGFMYLPKN